MSFLKKVRPSNLILLTALPFFVYMFATSMNYYRSLKAILGIEAGSGAFVPGFLLLLAAFTCGAAVPVLLRKQGRWSLIALVLAITNVVATLLLIATDIIGPFAASIVANHVDPFKSGLIVRGVSPRQLTEDAGLIVDHGVSYLAFTYGLLTIAGLGLAALGRTDSQQAPTLARISTWILGLTNGVGLVFVLFFAHIAFAAGVATTIRAAATAYILAAVLGLVWVGLLNLRYKTRTCLFYAGAAVLLALASVWFFMQPKAEYVLAGNLEGRVAIIKGTPSTLVEAVRYGEFPGATSSDIPFRSYATSQQALTAISANIGITAAMLPVTEVPETWPVLWTIEVLPDGDKSSGIIFLILCIVLSLLTFGGYLHKRHPLAIGSEFVVDTIRGIPMLVIVLYVGLPLTGSLKEMSNGVIDPPNLIRGIVAMGIAYSAYLAEIFRSGIAAIPAGQVEAAYSLGLNRWQAARLIILPQAFRIIIPPLGNELIAILKDTSLLSILSIRDITQRMREFQSASFLPFAPYNSAAIFYIFLTLAAASLITTVERKYEVKHR